MGDWEASAPDIARLDGADSTVDTGLRAIMFTDLEGSTAVSTRDGDHRAIEIIERHDRLVRSALADAGGREVKHTGDGILACFNHISRAVDCAIAIQQAFAEIDDDRPGGSGADRPQRRRAGRSRPRTSTERSSTSPHESVATPSPAQILVSAAVKELAIGKSLGFIDRGPIALKGFDDPVRLYHAGIIVDVAPHGASGEPLHPPRETLVGGEHLVERGDTSRPVAHDGTAVDDRVASADRAAPQPRLDRVGERTGERGAGERPHRDVADCAGRRARRARRCDRGRRRPRAWRSRAPSARWPRRRRCEVWRAASPGGPPATATRSRPTTIRRPRDRPARRRRADRPPARCRTRGSGCSTDSGRRRLRPPRVAATSSGFGITQCATHVRSVPNRFARGTPSGGTRTWRG